MGFELVFNDLTQGWAITVKYLTPCLSEGIGKITGSFMTQYDFPARNNKFLGQRSNFKISHPCPLISYKNQAFLPPISSKS